MENKTLLYKVAELLCMEPYSAREIAKKLGAELTSVRTYVCALKKTSHIKYDEVSGKYSVAPHLAPAIMAFARKHGAASMLRNMTNGNSTSLPTAITLQSDHEHPATTTEFAEYVSHLSWLLNEYIPHLENENEKAQQHANDLMRQMNSFVDVMKTAKTIHNRFIDKENDVVQ